jgi:hypothetical protein
MAQDKIKIMSLILRQTIGSVTFQSQYLYFLLPPGKLPQGRVAGK